MLDMASESGEETEGLVQTLWSICPPLGSPELLAEDVSAMSLESVCSDIRQRIFALRRLPSLAQNSFCYTVPIDLETLARNASRKRRLRSGFATQFHVPESIESARRVVSVYYDGNLLGERIDVALTHTRHRAVAFPSASLGKVFDIILAHFTAAGAGSPDLARLCLLEVLSGRGHNAQLTALPVIFVGVYRFVGMREPGQGTTIAKIF
jgi:hypothetical protein